MRRVALILALLSLPMLARASDCTRTSVGFTPLSDMGTSTYHGYPGGLYPDGANTRPPAHAALGAAAASQIAPRNALGVPDSAGKIVLLTIGMSNTRNESAQLVPMSDADPARDPHVLVVNGAEGGQDAETIANPAAAYWTYVEQQLVAANVTDAQVQAVWLKEAIAQPQRFGSFPASAQRLESDLHAIAQNLAVKFANLRQIFLASRIYAGYATSTLNPEPYSYESAFAVKWLIESQIGGSYALADPLHGILAPWLSWGPYLWSDGLVPRSDGLTWSCDDFNSDGTHPNTQGSTKVARMIIDFLHADSATTWYLRASA